MKKIELLCTIRGNTELWYAGTVFDYDTMPGEIKAEIAMDRGTVRVFEEVIQAPAAPPPTPAEGEPTFSEAARALLEEEEEKEPPFVAKHRGSGRWIVVDTETGERANKGFLNKKEAAALVKRLEEPSGFEEEKPTLKLRTDSD